MLSAPLSALTVNTLADELDAPAGAAVSLREAIRDTPAGGTIDFSISVDGGLSFLTKGELVISKNLTIDASSLSEGIRLTSRDHRLISIQSSGVSFNKLTFTGASSADNGGAIHISNNSTVSLFDCLVKGNQATGFGGGIYSNSSTLNLVNTSVIENSSVDEGGGGIFSTGATASLTLTGSTFQKNTAAKNGGAIQSTGNGTLSIVDSTLSDNSGRFGGGLSKASGALSITGSSITSNIATTAGGGLFLPRVTGDITNSTVAKNRSADNGGGITLDNNANLTVESCTIAANTSGNFGGGIFTQNSTLDLTNSIVATNLANASDDLHFQNGSITSGGANLVGINEGAETDFPADSPNTNGDLVGDKISPIDPALSPLGNFGGPSMAMHPLSRSPAIDSGGASSITTDQRGYSRVVGAALDIGAVETGMILRVTTATDENDGALGLGTGNSLRECIEAATAPGAHILFANSLTSNPITLLHGVMNTGGKTLFIDASAIRSGVTIDADNSSPCFTLSGAGSALSLEGLTLTKGMTSGNGSSVTVRDAFLNLSNCTLSHNTAERGGALISLGSEVRATATDFLDNQSQIGGAIESSASSNLMLDQCTFSGNAVVATAGLGKGGAIFSLVSTFTISHCNFSGNSSFGPTGGQGGALYYSNSLDFTDAFSSITQSTFHNNSSGQGGGIYIEGTIGDVLCRHLTIAGNSADAGGGLYVRRNGNALNHVTLDHCLVATNLSPLYPDIQYDDPTGGGGQLLSGGPNLIGNNDTVSAIFPAGPLAGTPATPLNPLLAPSGDHGGLTETLPLLAGSPAINAGTPTSDRYDSDQRGFTRAVGTAPDLGAYETGHLINYETWALEMIPSGLDAAFSGDSENDNILNGIEYAVGLNPAQSDGGDILNFTRVQQAGGTDYEAHLTFTYNPAISDLKYILQRNTNLEAFSARFNFDTSTGLQATHPSGNVSATVDPTAEQITIIDSGLTAGGGERFFWRLNVQQIE